MGRWWFATGIALLLAGCVKETTQPLVAEPPDVPVVDAVITNETKVHRITLTRPVATVNEVPKPCTGAGVLISNEDSTWQLAEEPPLSGIYCTPAWFSAKLDKNYTLLISWGGKIYTAKTYMVEGGEFTELTYAPDPGSGLYHIDWVANAFSTGQAALWEVQIDWSEVPGFELQDSTATRARLLFYTLPTLDVSEIFAPLLASVLFPAGSVINERRYSLTPQHAEFIREMLLETRWTGGLFPTSPANASGNVSNGALGYFGACWVNELSVVVAPK